ncbi:MAG: S8 family serine peptidase [bacterium]|nr:S8 family serine peptidase [bacterium]
MRARLFQIVIAAWMLTVGATDAGAASVELRLAAGPFDPLEHAAGEQRDGRYHVVQFERSIDEATLDRLRVAGAEPLSYLPDRAYVVRAGAASLDGIRALGGVRWAGAFRPEWKLAPDLGTRPFVDATRRGAGRMRATVELHPGEDLDAAARAAAGLGAELLGRQRFAAVRRLELRATRGQLERLARLDAVAWIEESGELSLRNDDAHWVVQGGDAPATPVWDRGLHGEGQIVGVIDSPIDVRSCFFRDPRDNSPGPDHRKIVSYRSSQGLVGFSHGTHVAGIVAGDAVPATGSAGNRGHAWAARIAFDNAGDIYGSDFDPSNLYERLTLARADGARVHSNSWGDEGTVRYTTWSRDADLFAYDHEDALVVFATSSRSTLRTPENAKNVLAVGATGNGTESDALCIGGRGPTTDGRRKPDLVAPGCGVASARNNSTCSTRTLSGTSMAAPAVAGAAALARQYFVEGYYPSGSPRPEDGLIPSGALLKAVLINAGTDLPSAGGFPGDREGWGRVALDDALYFDGDDRGLVVLEDRRNVDGLRTEKVRSFSLNVRDDRHPLEITLAYTEPPGAVYSVVATVNDLDLVAVSPGGRLHYGNNFRNGTSVSRGAPDARNNVEQLVFPHPETGEWSIEVHATAVNEGRQGFALVATGQFDELGAGLRYDSHVVKDAGPGGNEDGVADPGETIVLPVTLRNRLGEPAAGVSARLIAPASAPVSLLRDTARFPDFADGERASSFDPHFELAIDRDAPCGAEVELGIETPWSERSVFALPIGRIRIEAGSTEAGTIPYKSPTPLRSEIFVDEEIVVADANVEVRISHLDVSELTVRLTSPAGTSVTLHDKSGGGTRDIGTTFDLHRLPDGPGSLPDFDGQSARGTWTLEVFDTVGGEPRPTPRGVLRSWRLLLDARDAVCSPGTPAAAERPGHVTRGRAWYYRSRAADVKGLETAD